ncbi:MAG: VCBS repeat-containing protein [Candidatus Glassbacteria bacterium]
MPGWKSAAAASLLAALAAGCGRPAKAPAEPAGGQTLEQTAPAFDYVVLDTAFGHREVADIDGDGLNDIVLASNPDDAGFIAWYHYPGWERSLLADITGYEDFKAYRACDMEVCDIDNDGDPDIIGRVGVPDSDHGGVMVWWRNPRPDGDPFGAWERIDIGSNEYTKEIHAADFDRDGKVDVMSRENAKVQIWFQDNPRSWTNVEMEVHHHEGGDVGDLDSDGDPDIVLNGFWLETPDSARTGKYLEHDIDSRWWSQNEQTWMDNNCKVLVADVDRDGRLDVLLSQSEKPGYPVSLYRAEDPAAGPWREQVVAEGLDYVHNLQAADFDLDGDLDLFAGEMTKGDDPDQVVVFLNDGTSLSWRKIVLAATGCYSGIVGDVDTDGDMDILGLHNFDHGPLELWINRTRSQGDLSLARWRYIRVDSTRAKWGDWDKPEWSKYFGLAAGDLTHDGRPDIVSGRYFYRNPGGTLTKGWQRVDFGLNVDAMLFVDVDDDQFGDVIAQACPAIYWLETQDSLGSRWTARRIADQPPTDHGNGQGYQVSQLVPGGKPEILLEGGDGISFLEIPESPGAGEWPRHLIVPDSYGMCASDFDGDGLLDVAGFEVLEEEVRPVTWWKNPGRTDAGGWLKNEVGRTDGPYPDRILSADLNGGGLPDIVVTEESQKLAPEWKTYWFEHPADPAGPWPRHTIAVQYTTNALDLADMDSDGDIDVITGEHRGPKRLVIWENNGNGGFSPHLVDRGRENHLGARVFDLDGDGDLDIVGICWDSYQLLHLWRNDAIK